jgi:hypothetical protein
MLMEKALKLAGDTLLEFIRFASPYWPVLAALFFVYLIAILLRRRKVTFSPGSNSAVLDYFFRQGYEVEKVLFQGRMGAEYILSRLGAKTYLHIKWWRKPIDERSVQAVSEAKSRMNCEFAILVSKEGFTRRARRWAIDIGVWLWRFNRVESELERLADGIPEGMKAAAATKTRS